MAYPSLPMYSSVIVIHSYPSEYKCKVRGQKIVGEIKKIAFNCRKIDAIKCY